MFQRKKQKGQSTLEYILLVTAIIAIFIIFLRPDGPLNKHLTNAMNETFQGVATMTNRIGTK